MNLNNPDTRRGVRSVVQAIVALIVIALVWVIVEHLKASPGHLYGIAVGCLVIVGLGTLLYGAENVTRAVKFKGLGFEGGIGEDATAAAKEVAAAGDAKADEIAERQV